MSTFGFESTADEVLAGKDLHGRTALVTGGYSGLGRETARAMDLYLMGETSLPHSLPEDG